MLDPLWSAVDQSLTEQLVFEDAGLADAVRSMTEAGLPTIQVTPTQGKFLHLLARAIRATRILEIGTLAGYSTIWLARALPAGGSLTTLEIDPARAAIARANVDSAGVGALVDIRVGKAMDTLKAFEIDRPLPFDLVFIDADKAHVAEYTERSAALCRPGAIILVDNVVRNGRILESESDDPSVVGVRSLFDRVAANMRLPATVVQTVGSKGHDGFLMTVVGA
ncbi:MAG: O-methyltransferase [Phycisphaerae bacterium]|nr:O-methyltransferase [Phycisphaerae bacterium]